MNPLTTILVEILEDMAAQATGVAAALKSRSVPVADTDYQWGMLKGLEKARNIVYSHLREQEETKP